jgi:hypothetical protein
MPDRAGIHGSTGATGVSGTDSDPGDADVHGHRPPPGDRCVYRQLQRRVAGESAGTYAITQGSLALSSDYNLVLTPGVLFTLSRRAASGSPNPATKVYGTSDPALDRQDGPGGLAEVALLAGGEQVVLSRRSACRQRHDVIHVEHDPRRRSLASGAGGSQLPRARAGSRPGILLAVAHGRAGHPAAA